MNQANDEQQQLSKKTELMSNTRTSYVNLKKEKKIKIVQLNIRKEGREIVHIIFESGIFSLFSKNQINHADQGFMEEH